MSFGFAPNDKINQTTADSYDKTDTLRLSWHLDLKFWGGYRLGNVFINPNEDKFDKYVYLSA